MSESLKWTVQCFGCDTHLVAFTDGDWFLIRENAALVELDRTRNTLVVRCKKCGRVRKIQLIQEIVKCFG